MMKSTIKLLLVAFNIVHLVSCQHAQDDLGLHLGQEYLFEFGVPNVGETIYTLEGWTLKQHTEINLPVAANETITYIQVKVRGFFEPSVHYDTVERAVCIDYKGIQIPISHYDIVVKGIPFENDRQ